MEYVAESARLDKEKTSQNYCVRITSIRDVWFILLNMDCTGESLCIGQLFVTLTKVVGLRRATSP